MGVRHMTVPVFDTVEELPRGTHPKLRQAGG